MLRRANYIIMYLTRNSIKYIPTKDYKAFIAHLSKIYGAVSLESSRSRVRAF